MKFNNFRYNYQGLMQQVALVAAASFCLTSLAEAASVKTTQHNSLSNFLSHKVLIAQEDQEDQEDNVCPENSGGSQFVSAETKSFLVYICGGDEPNTYVGIAKNGSGSIALPLNSYTRVRFVAVNANTRYTLTRTELTVIQNGRVILRERATWKR